MVSASGSERSVSCSTPASAIIYDAYTSNVVDAKLFSPTRSKNCYLELMFEEVLDNLNIS